LAVLRLGRAGPGGTRRCPEGPATRGCPRRRWPRSWRPWGRHRRRQRSRADRLRARTRRGRRRLEPTDACRWSCP
jgi:hypothetical protein